VHITGSSSSGGGGGGGGRKRRERVGVEDGDDATTKA